MLINTYVPSDSIKKNLYVSFFIKAIVAVASSLILVLLLSIFCVYDHAGKSFHRLKVFEFNYKKHPNRISDSMRQLRHM